MSEPEVDPVGDLLYDAACRVPGAFLGFLAGRVRGVPEAEEAVRCAFDDLADWLLEISAANDAARQLAEIVARQRGGEG